MSEPAEAAQIPVALAMSAEERGAFLDRLGQVVHAERAYLAAVARGEGLTPEDALDIVQETFFRMISLPDAPTVLASGDDARRYLATVTRNLARNHRRLHVNARAHEEGEDALAALPDETATVEALVAAAEERIRLIGCVRTLAKVQRAVVTLRLFDEVAGEDTARSLGIAPSHVAVLLHRARRHLIACMQALPA